MIFDVNCHFGSDPSMPASYTEAELMALLKSAGIGRAIATELKKEGQTLFSGGVRMYPSYVQWDFEGPEMRELLSSGLIVQIYLRLQDPRVLPQIVSSAAAIEALTGLTATHNDVRFIVSGATLMEAAANKGLFTRENVWMDIAHVQHPTNSLEKLIDAIGGERILFGTNAPIFYPYANVFRVMESRISDEDRERILWRNAVGLFNGAA